MNTSRFLILSCTAILFTTNAGIAGANQPATENRNSSQGNPCSYKFSTTNDGTEFENPSAAINVLTACVELSENSPTIRAATLTMRSKANEQLHNYAQAIADREDSLHITPPRTAWEVIPLATLYRESGQPERALSLLRQMLNDHLGTTGKGTSPGMPSYYHLGITFAALEKWPEAAEAFSMGLTYQPSYSWAYLYRALSYDHMNNTDLAHNDVVKARSLINTLTKDIRENTSKTLQKPPFVDLLKKYPE